MTSHNNIDPVGSRDLDDACFSQSFTLPPTARRPAELKVTYADFGHRSDDRVLLFCGPLMGSRFVLATKDEVARKHGVRIISADRPGFGGTDLDAPPADRVGVWLEIVEALLQHLSIKHVSVVGYSCGSVYAMNVLLHLRHLLHPTRPYVAIFTPWVHPSHSGVSTLKAAGLLPNGLVGSFDRVLQFVGSLGPALQYSSILSGLVPSLSRGPDHLAPGADQDSVAREESLQRTMFRRIMDEDVRGVNQDALLLLKPDEFPGSWGTWGDYDTLVPLLAEAERARRAIADSSAGSGTPLPLKVRVFFAESDRMIGTERAPTWFDSCWRPEQRGDNIDYSSVTIPKTTHDTIIDLRYGVFQQIFEDMSS
ncbi:hypothetical protein F5Y14DRAFT_4273 [Nemania sp. NC0429]|nr:hypothetical protein F5Y14DRAFT_4273 [Nemania sp. NC0429]